MNYLCDVVSARPLVIHFSLHNPASASGPVFVPRVLGPYGLFVRATVRDGRGKTVLEPPAIRGTFKLDPKSAASYMPLEAGYSFGAVFELEDAPTEPGTYELEVHYSNKPYTGAPGAEVPKLEYKGKLTVTIP
ncbi:MAG: hypothetical protein IT303_10395 [Dehalococcoidia bacterium]|nr:hypothetical protein [Dehalococcoidia bacterium]